MAKYEIKYDNLKALKRLLDKLKDYIELDFYSEFSPPNEDSTEEDFVYGIQNELIKLHRKLYSEYADETQYKIVNNRELFD